MSARTYAQRARQLREHRENGRYAKVNPCEVCSKSAGVEYYSHLMTNEWGFALVLCSRCENATAHTKTEKEYLACIKTLRKGKR